MWRNEGRPLYFVYSKDQKLLVWASEIAMIYLAMDRNGIEFDRIREVPTEALLKWEIPARNHLFYKPEKLKLRGGTIFEEKP